MQVFWYKEFSCGDHIPCHHGTFLTWRCSNLLSVYKYTTFYKFKFKTYIKFKICIKFKVCIYNLNLKFILNLNFTSVI